MAIREDIVASASKNLTQEEVDLALARANGDLHKIMEDINNINGSSYLHQMFRNETGETGSLWPQ
ncbi:hypothetical protein M7I_3516 [Glarea lozoyensis 74030]|uniref:Uncharacterized protein n=1 Tax=Glarea lozoyensis (strain ATCC 74030 / MF5533) TaxID=1104152 RepID=H0ELP7_GLAL7|nr:hypothetical protein M7I_3516 [Glarea lozoyensis 74030]